MATIKSTIDVQAWHDGGDAFGPGAELGTSGANAVNLETNALTRATITSAGNTEIQSTYDLILLDQNELQLRDAVGIYYSYLKYGSETTALGDGFTCHFGSVTPGAGEIGFMTQGGGGWTFLYLDACPACNQNYAKLWMVTGGNGPVELRAIRKHSVNSQFAEVRLTAEGRNTAFGAVSSQLTVMGDHGITSFGAWYDATTATAAAITLDETNRLVTVDATAGPITITLPAIAAASPSLLGCRYDIKKTDASANAVIIDGDGAETIDGAATATLAAQYTAISISAGASEWHIW